MASRWCEIRLYILGTLTRVPKPSRDYPAVGLVGATMLPLLTRSPGFLVSLKRYIIKSVKLCRRFSSHGIVLGYIFVWVLLSHIIKEGEFMSRRLLSMCLCVSLAWLSGCAHCRARHAARVCCRPCEPCGCDSVGSAEYVKIQPTPGVTMPGPVDKGIPRPLDGIPSATVGAIPGPPRR